MFRYNGLPDESRDAEAPGVIFAVRNTYNPVAHARKMSNSGRFNCSIEILNQIPLEFIRDLKALAYLAAEKQRYYLAWQKTLPREIPPHKFLLQSRREFAQVTIALPYHQAAYKTQAEFWHHIGNDNMAERIIILPMARRRYFLMTCLSWKKN